MSGALRAVLTGIFLVAQISLAFHRHDAGVALRPSGRSRSAAAISANNDNCPLCAFQIQSRASVPAPIALAEAPVFAAVLFDVPSQTPLAALRGLSGARAPPAV